MSLIKTVVLVAAACVVAACGTPARTCSPGAIQSCGAPTGCLGTQTCNANGSGFGTCTCPMNSSGGGVAGGGFVTSGGSTSGGSAGGSTAGGTAGGATGGGAAGGISGGSAGCSSANCNGCCTARGSCVAAPDNERANTCGTAAQTCADCTVLGGSCVNFTCMAGQAGGSAGGNTAGGSTAGGSAAGGSTAGGSTAGGSTAGGSTAGGSTAGGSTAGGSTAGGSTAGGSTAGGSTAGGAGGGIAGGSTAGGTAGGFVLCGPSTCAGCCLPNNNCVGTPLNGNDITCGRNGAACQNCTISASTCSQTTFTCSGSVGGGSAGGASAGGSAGGTAGGTAGGAGGGAANLLVGDPCSTNTQCQATLGANGRCKAQNLNGSLPYSAGYCTIVGCGSMGVDDCPLNAICLSLPYRFGEEANQCFRTCTGTPGCRTSYSCFNVGSPTLGACLPTALSNPQLQFDTVATLHLPCTSSAQCRSPGGQTGAPFAGGLCLPEVSTNSDGGLVVNADGGLAYTGNPGGQCLRFCDADEDCSSTGLEDLSEGVCLRATATINLCFAGCLSPMLGQSNCRTGYVCDTLFSSDGGMLPTGYCEPRCDNIGGNCGTFADGGARICQGDGYCSR